MQTNTVPVAKKSMVILCYAMVYLVWGSTFFFIEKALHSFPPFVLGSLRFIMAGALLFIYCKMKGFTLWNKRVVKESIIVGFLLLFVDMAAIIWSEQYISSGIVSIISAATAIWFVLFDKSKWKENFSSLPTILGLLFGFGGVVMLFAEQLSNNNSQDPNADMKLIAMIVMVIGTMGWTFGSLISKYLTKSNKDIQAENDASEEEDETEDEQNPDLHIMVKTSWQMLTAGIAFTTVALITGEYTHLDWSQVATADIWSLIYLAIFGSIIAFSSYLWLLQVRPVTEVSTYAYINPIVAMTLVYFFTDHEVTKLQVFGLIIVLISVLLMNWNLYKNNRTIAALRNKRFRRHLTQRSSIPRIIELLEIAHLKDKYKRLKQK